MRVAWLLVANAIVSGFVGLIGVLFPGPLFDLFGGRSDIGSRFLVQLFGATLIGEALLRAGLRGIPPGALRTALTSAMFVEYVIAVFALGYAYFRFASPDVT